MRSRNRILNTPALDKVIHKIIHGHPGERFPLQGRHPQDLATLPPVPEAGFDVVLELGTDQPHRIVPPRMPDRILHQHLAQPLTVRQTYQQRARRGAFAPVVVIGRELRVFFEDDARPQRLDARVPRPGGLVAVVARFDHGALEQDDGDHVLHAVVAVGRVVQRALLVDDRHGGLLGSHPDVGNVGGRVQVPRTQGPADLGRGFDSGSAVAFDGVDLEEDILHHPALEGARKPELLSPEEGVVEAPARRRQDRGGPRLAVLDEEG